MTLVDAVALVSLLDEVVHALHVADMGGMTAVAFHAPQNENVCASVTPDATTVFWSGPLRNVAQFPASCDVVRSVLG